MEHLLDIGGISLIVILASVFLFRTFKKARAGCGSICSGCSGSCSTKVNQQFNNKSIILKKID